MKRGHDLKHYRFRTVRPVLPEPARWLPFLDESYAQSWFSNFGPVATRFEKALAAHFGAAGEAFVATCNATAGLAACLIAEGITGPVPMPAFTFPASAAAIRMAGAEPVLIDVSPDTWAVDVEALRRVLAITAARAVMLVAPFGIAQDFSAHIALCRQHRAAVVIDNAAGLGGVGWDNGGTVYEVYSLHATKPFAIGEGGAIRAAAGDIAALRSALNFGLPWTPGRAGAWGINGKMPESTAAIGLAVLHDYQAVVAGRQLLAQRYREMLRRFDGVALYDGPIAAAPWQVFPALMPAAAAAARLVDEAARQGLELRRYYRPSLTQWGGISCAGDCPVAEMLAERMVCLPVYSRVSATESAEIEEIVESCFEKSLAVFA